MNVFRWTLFTFLTSICFGASAMSITTKNLKPSAFFVKNSSTGLFQPLDLKTKTIRFSVEDGEKCLKNLKRKSFSLKYSCTITLFTRDKISRLRRQISPKVVKSSFNNTEKQVELSVSKDGRFLTLSTDFETTGIDFDVSSFNDEFHRLYAAIAVQIFTKAMTSQPLKIEVLEE